MFGLLLAGLAATAASVAINTAGQNYLQNSAQSWNAAESEKGREWQEMMFGKQTDVNREDATTAYERQQALDEVNRQFNAEQSAEQRAWASTEAQTQREWEEQQYATRYQTTVQDMRAAGINPILGMSTTQPVLSSGIPSGSTASFGGSSAPRANNASVPSTHVPNMSAMTMPMVDIASSMAMLQNADTAAKNASTNARAVENQNDYWEASVENETNRTDIQRDLKNIQQMRAVYENMRDAAAASKSDSEKKYFTEQALAVKKTLGYTIDRLTAETRQANSATARNIAETQESRQRASESSARTIGQLEENYRNRYRFGGEKGRVEFQKEWNRKTNTNPVLKGTKSVIDLFGSWLPRVH